MSKQRLEAFTDGVIAIIITIMVLDIKVPAGADFAAMRAEIPIFLAYALSFANVGIFWNNHHHMLHVTERINQAMPMPAFTNSSILLWFPEPSVPRTWKQWLPLAKAWYSPAALLPHPTWALESIQQLNATLAELASVNWLLFCLTIVLLPNQAATKRCRLTREIPRSLAAPGLCSLTIYAGPACNASNSGKITTRSAGLCTARSTKPL